MVEQQSPKLRAVGSIPTTPANICADMDGMEDTADLESVACNGRASSNLAIGTKYASIAQFWLEHSSDTREVISSNLITCTIYSWEYSSVGRATDC